MIDNLTIAASGWFALILIIFLLGPRFVLNEFQLRRKKNLAELIIIDEKGNATRKIVNKVPEKIVWAKDPETQLEIKTDIVSKSPSAYSEKEPSSQSFFQVDETILSKTTIFNAERKMPCYIIYTWKAQNINPLANETNDAWNKRFNNVVAENRQIGRLQATFAMLDQLKQNKLLFFLVVITALLSLWLVIQVGTVAEAVNSLAASIDVNSVKAGVKLF